MAAKKKRSPRSRSVPRDFYTLDDVELWSIANRLLWALTTALADSEHALGVADELERHARILRHYKSEGRLASRYLSRDPRVQRKSTHGADVLKVLKVWHELLDSDRGQTLSIHLAHISWRYVLGEVSADDTWLRASSLRGHGFELDADETVNALHSLLKPGRQPSRQTLAARAYNILAAGSSADVVPDTRVDHAGLRAGDLVDLIRHSEPSDEHREAWTTDKGKRRKRRKAKTD